MKITKRTQFQNGISTFNSILLAISAAFASEKRTQFSPDISSPFPPAQGGTGWNRLPAADFGRPARNLARSSRTLRFPHSALRVPNSALKEFSTQNTPYFAVRPSQTLEVTKNSALCTLHSVHFAIRTQNARHSKWRLFAARRGYLAQSRFTQGHRNRPVTGFGDGTATNFCL